MSYLAFNAAPIQNENINNNPNEKKRNTRNKTLKKYNSNGRISDIMNQIHNSSLLNDDEDDMGDFNLPLPESVGSQRKGENELKTKEENLKNKDLSQGKWQGSSWHQNLPANNYAPYPLQYNEEKSLNDMSEKQNNEENDKKGDDPVNIDGFKNLQNSSSYSYNVPYYNQMSLGNSVANRDELLSKLNYMIHILEEQQDHKTGHVTEEVILYSFLGIFIIFVIDSFARAGKYVR